MSSKTFHGGVHPKEYKELTEHLAFELFPLPEQIILPLSQHLGKEAKALVKKGEDVKAGQMIAQAEGFVSAPVHSSVAGKVMSLGKEQTSSGFPKDSIVIKRNGTIESENILLDPLNSETITPDEIRERVALAGIVGQGGAAFPTVVKLSPPKEKTIDAILLNGAECEPYLTADYRLMLEKSKEIVEGLKITMRIRGVQKGYIGIEDNKPDAIAKMKEAAAGQPDISIITCHVKYPQGAEKMLIKAVLGREVPPKALPMDVGVVVQNVGTALAIYEAARFGKPLIERVVTVTGEGIKQPKNLMARIGSKVGDLIEECGGFKEGVAKVISGGPMMGFALSSLDVAVTKGTSGILVIPEEIVTHTEEFGPCIRCGRCIDICPMGLMPSMLSVLSEKGFYEEAKEYNLYDCFECGSCAYVCPSKRPIVQFVRLAKSMVKP